MVRADEPGGLRELLRVAVPLALSTGTYSVMLVTDRLCLTWYSKDALAASMPAGLLNWTLVSFALGVVMYVTAFVAQYYGAGRRGRVGASVWQGIYFSIAASVLLAPSALLAGPVFDWVGHPPAVRALEVDYFRILILGACPALVGATLSCFYNGRGKTLPVVWVNVAAMIVNCVLDFVLVFGWGPVPPLGVSGAALATVAGSCAGVAAYLLLLALDVDARGYGLRSEGRLDVELLRRLVRFGAPNGLMMLLEAGSFNVFMFLVGRMGTVELAATNLAFTLNTLAFVPIVGLQTAVLTLVGQRIGDGRPELAERTTWVAAKVCTAYMAVWAVLYVLLPDVALWAFAVYNPQEFQKIRDMSVVLLRFVAAYTVFDGWQLVFGAATRGAGDTRFSLWFHAGTAWVVMVVPTYIAVEWFGGGIFWAWTVVTFWVVVLAAGFFARFRGGKWKAMRVIEPVVVESAPDDDPGAEDRPSVELVGRTEC